MPMNTLVQTSSWELIDVEIGILADDPSSESFLAETRIAMFNRAMEFFAQTHTAPLMATGCSVTGAGEIVSIPSDYIQLAGVRDLDIEAWLTPAEIRRGGVFPTEGYIGVAGGLRLLQDLPLGGELWYYAFYPSISGTQTKVYLPKFGIWPVLNLTMAYLLYPWMTGQANYRQFQTKREAGQPTDNPPREQAKYFMEQYHAGIATMKPQMREVFRAL